MCSDDHKKSGRIFNPVTPSPVVQGEERGQVGCAPVARPGQKWPAAGSRC